MPKVSAHYGITIPGSVEFSSVRVDSTFTDIDTDGDVPAQIAKCLETQALIEEAADKDLAQKAANVSGLSLEGLGVAADLKAFEERMIRRTDSIIGEVDKHKATLEAADANGILKIVKPKPKVKAKRGAKKAKEE